MGESKGASEVEAKSDAPPQSSSESQRHKEEIASSPVAVDVPGTQELSERSWKACSQVLAGFLFFFNSWGLVNSFGVFQATYTQSLPPLASPSLVSWVGSIQSFSVLFLGVFTGPIFDAGHARILVVLGTTLLVLGLVFTSITGPSPNAPNQTYWQVILAQGLCVGFGMGLTFLPSIAIPGTYFKRHRVFAVGVAMTGSSLGGIIYPVILRALLPRVGFRWAVRVVALVVLVTAGSACVLLKQRGHTKRPSLVVFTALKELRFTILIAGLFCSFVGVYVPYFYIEIKALSDGVDLKGLESYWLVSLLNVGGIFGRLAPNFIADKVNPLSVHTICVVIGGVLIFVWPFAQSLASLVVFTLLYGFFSGAFISLPPASIGKLTPDMAQIGGRLGLGFTVNSFAVLVGPPIAGAILRTGGYSGMSIFAGVITTVGGLLIAVARFVKDDLRSNIQQ